ncbi:beta-crystallin A1-like protein [Lates japonicus]|uniref:Beta-crystallin A1-like protein n=1 Tax=Lates japonicus TaxID=270547 RepID=A0AAD3N8G8_LATJO|nr:beta-crystallin A1-like protein [Lates japonicus]
MGGGRGGLTEAGEQTEVQGQQQLRRERASPLPAGPAARTDWLCVVRGRRALEGGARTRRRARALRTVGIKLKRQILSKLYARQAVGAYHSRALPIKCQSRSKDVQNYKVTVFEQEHFQGKCLEFTSECCNIQECGLDNISSIRVESGAWVGFEHHDFQGQQFILERGEYPHWDAYSGSLSYHVERLMSLRPIYCASHQSSRMIIFERENFMGRSVEICDDYPSLQGMGWMMPEVGSMHVQCGAFVCYQYPGYRGQQYIMECERHSGDYQHWRNWGSHCQTPQIQSIRRIQH